ncbi:MAG: hypothetical protein QOJ98_1089 [Acidobacteriota bacterium]|nr:hypothetical protein [Acidobacteriota bacterium]
MIYRKRGRTIRREHGTTIEVTESGVAYEEGERFICEPAPVILSEGGRAGGSEGPPAVHEARAVGRGSFAPALPASLTQDDRWPVTVERLIAVEGVAEHEYGDRTWSEHTQRLHVALTHNRLRALIDQADFDTTHIQRVVAALARCEEEREAPPRLRLAANITAALLPALVDLAPPNVRVVQTAGGIDGRGEEIVEATKDWPNWYRPSYRIRPVKAPLNLRIECGVTEIDPSRPIAIALLAPVTGLTLRLLVEDGARAYPATVRVTRIDAVSNERTWYPYGAGSFGAEMML